MTLGEPDGVGAGLAGLAGGAEGAAAPVLLGPGPVAGWAEGLAQPAARTASPAARAVSAESQPRLPVIGRLQCLSRGASRRAKPIGPGTCGVTGTEPAPGRGRPDRNVPSARKIDQDGLGPAITCLARRQ
jgi:hypothetical protein